MSATDDRDTAAAAERRARQFLSPAGELGRLGQPAVDPILAPGSEMKPTTFRRRSRIGIACSLMFASAVLASATSAQPPAQPHVVLLGTPSLPLGLSATTIQESGEFRVQVNGEVDSAAIVLLVIHAPDGLLSSGVDELRRRQGKTLARAAILVTSTDLVDPELVQLVLLEAREVFGAYLGEEETTRLEVLKLPDPEFVTKLKALLFLPPVHVRIAAPQR